MNDSVTHIEDTLYNWQRQLSELPANIVALNIGIQELSDTNFEIFLEGFDWYETEPLNDIWLLDAKWEPRANYIKIGGRSCGGQRDRLLEIIKSEFAKLSNATPSFLPKQIEFVSLTARGKPFTLFRGTR